MFYEIFCIFVKCFTNLEDHCQRFVTRCETLQMPTAAVDEILHALGWRANILFVTKLAMKNFKKVLGKIS